MNKKDKNIIIMISAIFLFFLFLTGIAIVFRNDKPDEIKYNKPYYMVKNYVQSLIDGDYSKAFKFIYLPQDASINKSDFETYIKSKDIYKDITNMKINRLIEEATLNYQVELIDSSDNVLKTNIDLVERTINDYRIDENELYLIDYRVTVPKTTKLYISDYLIGEEFLDRTSELNDEYLIPAIAKNKKMFKLENKLSTNEIEVDINEKSSGVELEVELNNEELKKKAYDYIKNTWNSLYTEYKKKSNVSKVKGYFDESFTESDINKIYKTAFDKITKGRTDIGEFNSYNITAIRDSEKEKSLVLNDELIKVGFGYSLSWKWKYISANSAVKMSMNRYSSIILRYDGENFKIHKIVDPGLFDYVSQYTRDFK